MTRSGRPREYEPIADDISFAIQNMDNDKARELLAGLSVDILDGDGRSPLIYAALSGNLEMLEWLIKNEASIDMQDRGGWTALHAASQNQHARIVSKLIENNANTNLTDNHGNGPLWTATMNARGDDAIANKLREAGADGDHKNNHDNSPNDMVKLITGSSN